MLDEHMGSITDFSLCFHVKMEFVFKVVLLVMQKKMCYLASSKVEFDCEIHALSL